MSLIMFDMDGTLINSGTMIANTINHVRENLGLQSLDKKIILENINDPEVNSAAFLYETSTFSEEQRELFETYYNENCLKELVIYDGIKELLDELKDDFTLSVATNANSGFANKMLDHLNLSSYFSSVLGFNDVKNAKPHPEMINKILDIHNIDKSKAQVIGDSHKDIQAATNAGVDSVLVNWGFSNHKENVANNIDELKEEIYNKFKA